MARRLTLLLVLGALIGLIGCASEEKVIPELLEPAGVQIDTAKARMDEIYNVDVYTGEIVPYVEELLFQREGIIEEVNVTLGDVVTKGQVLASLSDEESLLQIEELEEEIAQIKTSGEYSDRQKTADIEIARIELDKMEKDGAREQDCRLKKVDLQKLEKALEQSQELRQLELQELQEKLNKLRSKINNNQITAPFDGRVVYLESAKKGDTIVADQTMICVADESRLRLKTDYVSETVIKNSDTCYAMINGKEYNVTYVPYEQSEYVAMMISGSEMVSYFTIDAQDAELENGQFAVVMVTNAYKENVLTIPVNALYKDKNGTYVYKIQDGQQVRCDVTVGSSNDIKVEILEGLEEGDVVYVME